MQQGSYLHYTLEQRKPLWCAVTSIHCPLYVLPLNFLRMRHGPLLFPQNSSKLIDCAFRTRNLFSQSLDEIYRQKLFFDAFLYYVYLADWMKMKTSVVLCVVICLRRHHHQAVRVIFGILCLLKVFDEFTDFISRLLVHQPLLTYQSYQVGTYLNKVM